MHYAVRVSIIQTPLMYSAHWGVMQSIHNLLFQYANFIDAGNFNAIGLLFAHGKIFSKEGDLIAEGSTSVENLYKSTTRLYSCGTPRTHHIVSNIIIEHDPSTNYCTSCSRFTVLQQTPELTLQAIIAGTYHDSFTRHNGIWQFTSRTMTPTLIGNTAEHLLFTLPST